jgi:hypothetical protein
VERPRGPCPRARRPDRVANECGDRGVGRRPRDPG